MRFFKLKVLAHVIWTIFFTDRFWEFYVDYQKTVENPKGYVVKFYPKEQG
jgi:hypothetical protein